MITVFKSQAVNCVAKFYSTISSKEIYPKKTMRKLEGGATKDILWKQYISRFVWKNEKSYTN